jgi:hypothetical protein
MIANINHGQTATETDNPKLGRTLIRSDGRQGGPFFRD